MNLYVKKGTSLKGEKGELLVNKAWTLFTGLKEFPGIKRTDKGKPYFENSGIHFSISHSGDIWVCLFANFNIGVDIQIMRDGALEAIADRFFTEEEAETVRNEGKTAFYRIWTTREACGKYAGTGFALPEKIDPYPFFNEVFISSNYLCMTAAAKEENIWIMEIN